MEGINCITSYRGVCENVLNKVSNTLIKAIRGT